MKQHLPDNVDSDASGETPPADETPAADTPADETSAPVEPAATVTVDASTRANPKPARVIEGPRGRWEPPPPPIGAAFDHLIRRAYFHERGRVIDFDDDDLERVRRQLSEQPRYSPNNSHPWRR